MTSDTYLIGAIVPVVAVVVGWFFNGALMRRHETRLARGRVYEEAIRVLDELYREICNPNCMEKNHEERYHDKYFETSIRLAPLQIWAGKKTLKHATRTLELIDSLRNNEDDNRHEDLVRQYREANNALFRAMRRELWCATKVEVFKYKPEDDTLNDKSLL